MINPEMIVAKLFTECLGDDEALTMIGCEQFNSYTGYAGSFRWAGDFRDATPLDMYRRRKCRVVAIDAIFYKSSYEQFKEETFRRELKKAFVGFASDDGNDKAPVATGLWGCGAFNGHTIRSALIQLMTCAVTHRNLVFYTFGDETTSREVADVFQLVSEQKISVGRLFQLMKRYRFDGSPNDPTQFVPFIRKEIEIARTAKKPSTIESKPASSLKQGTLFNFVKPAAKLFSSESRDSEEKLWTWKRTATTSEPSSSAASSVLQRDKEKFDQFAITFGNLEEPRKISKAKPEPEREKPKRLSLIDCLDEDMEMSKK